MHAQVDDEGQYNLIMGNIIEYQSDEYALKNYYTSIKCVSNRHMCNTIKGWQLLVIWKNGKSTWEILKDLKESKIVKVA